MEFIIKSPKYGEKIVLIDDEDYDKIKNHTWYVNINQKTKYFYVTTHNLNKTGSKILLHRLILNCPKNKFIDHINHNTLDNRKSNLRICTQSENNMNRHKCKKSKSSNFKGVTWNKKLNKWIASIRINGKLIYLGKSDYEIESAVLYNNAALKYFGEFALLNII